MQRPQSFLWFVVQYLLIAKYPLNRHRHRKQLIEGGRFISSKPPGRWKIRVSGGSPANTHATSKIEGVRQVNLLGMGVKSGAQSITWTSGIIPSQQLRGYCPIMCENINGFELFTCELSSCLILRTGILIKW